VRSLSYCAEQFFGFRAVGMPTDPYTHLPTLSFMCLFKGITLPSLLLFSYSRNLLSPVPAAHAGVAIHFRLIPSVIAHGDSDDDHDGDDGAGHHHDDHAGAVATEAVFRQSSA